MAATVEVNGLTGARLANDASAGRGASQEDLDHAVVVLAKHVAERCQSEFNGQADDARQFLKDSKEQVKGIERVQLIGKGLRVLPPELESFTSLKGLNVSDNKLTDLSGWEFNLDGINVSKNQFESFPVAIFDNVIGGVMASGNPFSVEEGMRLNARLKNLNEEQKAIDSLHYYFDPEDSQRIIELMQTEFGIDGGTASRTFWTQRIYIPGISS